MTSCLILGGAGFIGSHLAERLLESGHRVRVFDRPRLDSLPFFTPRPELEIATGDFLNLDDLEQAMAGIDVVFHLISTTLPKTSNDNPAYDIETNVLATLRMLELCRRHQVRKILFVSSGGTVYGIPTGIPIPETHPTEPICSYGIHKLMIEKYLRLNRFLHGVDYCVVRPSNLYGERQRADTAQGAVAVFLERALRGKTIQIWGDGSVVRDYLYIGDAVEAFVKALNHGGPQRIFNVGGGVGTSLNELLKEIQALVGSPLAVEYSPPRSLDVPVNVLDCSLAGRVLGWQARTTLAEGLRRTADWMRAH